MNHATHALLLLGVLTGCGPGGPVSLGAVLGYDRESLALHVREVPPGLAAARAGLLPGDEILMIDGFYVKDLSLGQLRDKLRGETGTQVSITVVRGDQVKHFLVTRAPMPARPLRPPREERIAE